MKKIFSILALLFGLLPCMSLTAYAASVSYVDGNGTSQTVDATELESTTTSWTDGSWYIVPEGGLTISGRIAVSGTVNLILRDGTELTASAGITTTNATLNIYAQSTGTGALTATGANGASYSYTGGNAGIGGIGVGVSASGGAGGTVNIYGGTVTATGGNGDTSGSGGGGAGIGGGGLGWTSNAGSGAGGTVNIYGGTVTATGGTGGESGGGGAGIGGGGYGYGCASAGGTVNIYGGTVTATGGTGGNYGGVGEGIGGGGYGEESSAGAGGTLTLGVGVKLYNGTDNTGTVLDDNDSESRNYSGSRPQNMFAEGTVAAPATVNITANADASGVYWSTFYNASQGYTADASTTIYKGSLSGSSLQLTVVTDIAAGQAVILKSTTGTITLTPAATTSSDFTGNDLKGGTTVASGYDAYTLSRGGEGSGTLGFYKYSGATLDGSKAHLEILASAGARSFIGIGDDNTTAIELPAVAEDEAAEWYSLDGRRLSGKPARKGIYVRNGQKYIIR